MTKIDIFSGFLGAGKTTLIKKLIKEAYAGEKVVLIENEFGEIGIDGGFLQDAGIEITEMNSGCICCSLVGDFAEALSKVIAEFSPDRILIEPSGVGKLSDVIRAVQSVVTDQVMLNGFTTVVDVNKCKVYMKNFGEFYNDQIANASAIILSHTGKCTKEKIAAAVELLREKNDSAVIVTTDWDQLTGAQILEAMEQKATLTAELERLSHDAVHHHHDDEECECHHHHDDECDGHHHHDHEHHHDDDEECECHHHHDDDECDGHHHHDHEHDHDGHHHHDHEHDHDGHHHHDHEHDHDGHHHHHHADDVFASWGRETTAQFTVEQIESALGELNDVLSYGMVLRAKGIVESTDGKWIHFDYVPGEVDVRYGQASVIGRICVIGSGIDEDAIAELFHL